MNVGQMQIEQFTTMSHDSSNCLSGILKPILATIAVCTLSGVTAGQDASRPNIVIILADDMSTDSVAAFNPTLKIPTTNLDRLVAQGMAFTDAHTACSVCTPTRYGLLTGRYPWRTRLKSSVLWSYAPPLMDPERLNLASMLKQRGYHTACIGKWHLGWRWKSNDGQPIVERNDGSRVDFSAPIMGGPTDVGFDYYFGDDVPNFSPYAWIENNRLTAMPTIEKPDNVFGNPGPMVPGWKLEDVLPELSRRAVLHVTERSAHDEPYFLYLPLTSPHAPIAVARQFRGMSGTTLYGDFVQETDWVVGQVMQAIKDSGEADNTIVIFTTDNGTSLGFPRKEWQAELRKKKHFDTTGFELPGQQKWKPEYGDFEHTLRGGKFALYEGGHRVPFIVRWPDRVKAGTRNASLISLNDVMATVAELVQFKLPSNAAEDSFSFVTALAGEQVERPSPVVATDFGGRFSVRKGSSKIIFGKKGVELYDLSNDLKETKNLVKERPSLVEEMTRELRSIVQNGRSTEGPVAENTGGQWWSQLPWPK
jgi:arylsulfatase A